MATGKRETETQRFLSFVKLVFAVTAVVGVIVMAGPGPRAEAVALLNLWVDLVAGFFTVWGLVWAAQEFTASQVRPQIHLLPGRPRQPPMRAVPKASTWPVIRQPPYELEGWRKMRELSGGPTTGPNLACGVYLENLTPRAGRFVRLVMKVEAVPEARSLEFFHYPFTVGESRVFGERDPQTRRLGVSIQFSQELVVYQCPAFVGVLMVEWNKTACDDELPEVVELFYDVYTLDSASSGVSALHVTRWSW